MFKPGFEDGCEPACPGCAHRELGLGESMALKRAAVLRAFSELAEGEWREGELAEGNWSVAPLRASGHRYGYRGKVCLRARWVSGSWSFGFLEPLPRGSRLKAR